MSEERRQVHPQEPAEGSEESVQAPGADKPDDHGETDEVSDEERSSAHPREPAEGGEEEVEAPGAYRYDGS